jgi:hypothetical protein
MDSTVFTVVVAFTVATVAGRGSAMSTVVWTGLALAAWSAISLVLALTLGGMLRRREDQVHAADTPDAPTGSPPQARRRHDVG